MTLATQIRIIGDVSPEGVFAKVRDIIGIPQEQPFKIGPDGWGSQSDNGWIGTYSTPGGFRSALDMFVHPGGDADAGERLHDPRFCDDPEEYPDGCGCFGETPPCNIIVRLDTAYGMGRDGGPSCDEIHRDICRQLGDWLIELGCDWWAQDESWGDWHHQVPCPLTKAQRELVLAAG